MSNFSKFMKTNKVTRENVQLPVTESLIDPDTGKPVLWTIRPLTSNEVNRLQNECTKQVLVDGKKNKYKTKFDTAKWTNALVCASVVEPNLYDAELQDSYGVKTPEELIEQLIDDPGEFNALSKFIQEFNHLDLILDDKVVQAKN